MLYSNTKEDLQTTCPKCGNKVHYQPDNDMKIQCSCGYDSDLDINDEYGVMEDE